MSSSDDVLIAAVCSHCSDDLPVLLQHVEERSQSLERGKVRQKARQLQEECQQKEAAYRYAAAELLEKTRKVEEMQSEYYALDRHRQELRKLLSFSQGGMHEHRDRTTCLNDQLKRKKEEYRSKVRSVSPIVTL